METKWSRAHVMAVLAATALVLAFVLWPRGRPQLLYHDDHFQVMGVHNSFNISNAGLVVVCLNMEWYPKPGVELECLTTSGIRKERSGEKGCVSFGLTNDVISVKVNGRVEVTNDGFDCILVTGDY